MTREQVTVKRRQPNCNWGWVRAKLTKKKDSSEKSQAAPTTTMIRGHRQEEFPTEKRRNAESEKIERSSREWGFA